MLYGHDAAHPVYESVQSSQSPFIESNSLQFVGKKGQLQEQQSSSP